MLKPPWLFLEIVFALLFFSVPVGASLQHGSLKVFAITEDGSALTADISLEIVKGSGKIWTSVRPLVGTSTQTTERIAVDVARRYSGEIDKFDYLFDINSEASLVEGPSAGAAMALLVVSMLQDKQIPQNVGLTGTITKNGEIGNVGGVFEKSKEAARVGIKLLMIPQSEAQQIIKEGSSVRSINLSAYALEQWGMKVVEVATIDDALKYAFTEIGAIDVNKAKEEIPEFVPEPITFSLDLAGMHGITRKLVEATEGEVRDAKAALSTTLLRDARVVEVLLKSLNSAESSVKQARILLDQNYLFSAANSAFLGRVNAAFVAGISEKPSILSPDSVAFELRLLNLKTELDALKRDLNSFMAIEGLEWHIAAQQRLSWAELKIKRLESKSPIIIVPGSTETEVILGRIQDMEFAAAWIGVAKEFFAISSQSKRKAVLDNFFGVELGEYLVEAEEGLGIVKPEESQEAKEKIDAAKLKREYGWNAAAAFDAAFSLALSEEAVFSQEKSLGELKEKLNTGIKNLDTRISETSNGFIWAQLYLDHARYFSKAVAYYESFGQFTRASNAAKNGISLLFLAENLFEVTSKLKTHYSLLPPEKLLDKTKKPEMAVEKMLERERLFYSAAIGFLVIVLLILLAIILLLLRNIRGHGALSVEKQIDYIGAKQKRLERDLASANISRKEYEKQKAMLDSSLKQLLSQKESISSAMVKLSKLKSHLLSTRLALKRIKKQYHKGIITEEHFKRAEKGLLKQIKKAVNEIKNQESVLEAQKPVAVKKREISKFQAKTGPLKKENLPAVRGEAFLAVAEGIAPTQKPQPKKQKRKARNQT